MKMSFFFLMLGVVGGWCGLLVLPWALTGNPNPLDLAAGKAMLVTLLFPLYFLGEAGDRHCPKFTQKRLVWLSKNARLARLKLVLMGVGIGLLFTLPSAVMFTLAIAYLPGSPALAGMLLWGLIALIHAVLFGVSFFTAIECAEDWARKVYAAKRNRESKNA